MKKKRILFVNHGNAQGGAFISLYSLIAHIDRNCYEPVVCGSKQYDEVLNSFALVGIRTHPCQLTRFAHTTGGHCRISSIKSIRRFYKWLLDYDDAKNRLAELISVIKPDIVHFNSLTFAPYASVPKEMGIPNIVHVRETIVDGFFGIRKRWLVNQLLNNADKIICICRHSAEQLRMNTEKLCVIYDPILFNKFSWRYDPNLARQELSIPLDSKTILFGSGSVPWEKGLGHYIAAMGIANQKEPELLCLTPSFSITEILSENKLNIKERFDLIIRKSRSTERFISAVRKHKLLDSIKGCPFTTSMEKWISAADVACIPHISPHFSRTLIEAAAMKTPVVGYDIGGIREAIIHNETGILVKQNDIQALANAVVELLNNTETRTRLGEGAYEIVRVRHDPDTSAQKVMDIYRELINKL